MLWYGQATQCLWNSPQPTLQKQLVRASPIFSCVVDAHQGVRALLRKASVLFTKVYHKPYYERQ